MSTRVLGGLVVPALLFFACASDPEPAANQETKSQAPETTASSDAAPVAQREPELQNAERMALVTPASEGLPEVRYYSLGGA